MHPGRQRIERGGRVDWRTFLAEYGSVAADEVGEPLAEPFELIRDVLGIEMPRVDKLLHDRVGVVKRCAGRGAETRLDPIPAAAIEATLLVMKRTPCARCLRSGPLPDPRLGLGSICEWAERARVVVVGAGAPTLAHAVDHSGSGEEAEGAHGGQARQA